MTSATADVGAPAMPIGPDVLRRLVSVVDELAAMDPSTFGDTALADSLVELRRVDGPSGRGVRAMGVGGARPCGRPGRRGRFDGGLVAASGRDARRRCEGRDRVRRGVGAARRDGCGVAVGRDPDRVHAHDRRSAGTDATTSSSTAKTCSSISRSRATCGTCSGRPRTSATSPAPTAPNHASRMASISHARTRTGRCCRQSSVTWRPRRSRPRCMPTPTRPRTTIRVRCRNGAPRRSCGSARSRSSASSRANPENVPAARSPTWSTVRRSPTRRPGGATVCSPARSTPTTCARCSATARSPGSSPGRRRTTRRRSVETHGPTTVAAGDRGPRTRVVDIRAATDHPGGATRTT